MSDRLVSVAGLLQGNSGQEIINFARLLSGGMGDAKVPPLPPEALNFLQEGRGPVSIASRKEDAGKPYRVFTRVLMEALCGQGVTKKDGYVPVSCIVGKGCPNGRKINNIRFCTGKKAIILSWLLIPVGKFKDKAKPRKKRP